MITKNFLDIMCVLVYGVLTELPTDLEWLWYIYLQSEPVKFTHIITVQDKFKTD